MKLTFTYKKEVIHIEAPDGSSLAQVQDLVKKAFLNAGIEIKNQK